LKIYRPTILEINLKNLRKNLLNIKKKVKKNVKILAVVKADAYGHGAREVAKYIEDIVDWFGVALFEEGIELRKVGIKKPVLVMGSVFPLDNFRLCFKYDLTPTISSYYSAEYLSKLALRYGKDQRVHIKVDTGMGRIGINIKRAYETIKRISKLNGIKIDGVFSHLAQAEKITSFTMMQIRSFKNLKKALESEIGRIPLFHIANSTATFKIPESHFDMVRPGISIYGLFPYKGVLKDVDLDPVMSFKTKIVFLKEVEKGTSISYGRTWIAKRRSTIATLPVGYADGYNRLLSNKGEVLIRGKRFPVVGRVCMDMVMVDVTDLKNPQLGEEVVLWGKQGNGIIRVEEIADKISTINYEVTASLPKRVPRIYLK